MDKFKVRSSRLPRSASTTRKSVPRFSGRPTSAPPPERLRTHPNREIPHTLIHTPRSNGSDHVKDETSRRCGIVRNGPRVVRLLPLRHRGSVSVPPPVLPQGRPHGRHSPVV